MKSKIRTLLVVLVLLIMMSCNDRIVKKIEPLIDQRDGKGYQCKKIGDKLWMVENLAYQTINNSPYYASDSARYSIYGRLYFVEEIAEAVNIPGWHLPDTSEWMELLAFYKLEGGGNFGRGRNHYKCADWEKNHIEDITNFLSNDTDGFNYKLGGLWHLKWLDPSTNQRSFEKMGQSGYYWAHPVDSSNHYSHIGMGEYKYWWIEVTNEKPSSTYKSGEDFRFSVRLVKD